MLSFGLQDIFEDLFNEVHRSNMSKASVTHDDAQATVNYYKEVRNVDGHIVQKDDKFIVYRDGDQKILKSVKYHPANL